MRRAACLTTTAAVASTAAAALRRPTTTTAAATITAVRPIYTTWGSVPNEGWATKENWLHRITSPSEYRSFDFWHVPEVSKYPVELDFGHVEKYLLSCILDDTTRLLHLNWGYDFDPFWHDRINSHSTLFKIIYSDEFPIYRYIFGNCGHKTAEKLYIEEKLNYLQSVLYWAARTERRFTAITKARYHVQREVWNALERERYLCACVDAVESYKTKIPEEFRQKAIGELEVSLVNMRHWCYDCPNAKRTFTRQLA